MIIFFYKRIHMSIQYRGDNTFFFKDQNEKIY